MIQQVSMIQQNVAVFRPLIASNMALIRLNELSARLASQESLPALLQAIIDAATDLTNAPMGDVQLISSDAKSLSIIAQRGLTPSFLEYFSIAPLGGQSPCSEAMRLSQRVIIKDLCQDACFSELTLSIIKEANVRALQSTPIVARDGKLLGVFSTYWDHAHQPSDETLQILDLLARMAAGLIEHQHREEALRKAKEKAEEINHAKDIFLATLSHELRTPLTALLCWVQSLKRNKKADVKILEGLQSIEGCALAQNQLIEDLLDVSSIVMGKLSVKRRKIPLIKLLRKTIDSIRPAAENKNIALKVCLNAESDTDIFISGDSSRLRQIFLNLLTNAIKFTPAQGFIKVELENNSSLNQVKIVIEDSGIGIKADFLPYIFDRFQQADSSHSRRHGGLGLGLTIVRNLLKLQKGTIVAASEGENQGAKFTITFPTIKKLS